MIPATVVAALEYVGRGWAVFPLHGIQRGRCTCGRSDCSSPGKHPLTRRGLHDATRDENVVRRWWWRWRGANVAVATGEVSAIAVVDIDLPGALGSLEHVLEHLPPTLTGLAGGGGLHLVYACERKLGNKTGRLPGLAAEVVGIDLRGDGGYVVAPPSRHRSGVRYSWLDDAVAPVLVPDWMQEAPRPRQPRAAVGPAHFHGDGSAYGLHVLSEELARLGRAAKGRRNHELNRAAFTVAQVTAGGELLEASARAALVAEGVRIGLTEHEVALTIASAFRAGSAQPRCAPHRLRG